MYFLSTPLTQIGLPSGADLNTTWDTNGVIATGAVAQTAGGTITETYTPADTAWPVASPLKASVTWGGNAYATSLLTVRDDMRVTAENYTKAGALQFAQGYTTSPANTLTSIEDLVAFPDITTTNQFFDAASFLRGRVSEEYSAIDNAQAIALATNPNNIVTDLNGNIIAIELPTSPGATTLHRWAFSYDFENRLTKIVYTDGLDAAADSQAWEFGYDGLGRRVWTQVDGAAAERLIYTGDQLVQSRSALDDSLNMEYTYGPTAVGGPAIYKQWDGTTKEWFYTSPQDAFPRFKMNNSGVITKIYQYSSKGDYVAGYAAVADAPAFGWQGKWAFGLDTPLPLLIASPAYSPTFGRPLGSHSSAPVVRRPGQRECEYSPEGCGTQGGGAGGDTLSEQKPPFEMPDPKNPSKKWRSDHTCSGGCSDKDCPDDQVILAMIVWCMKYDIHRAKVGKLTCCVLGSEYERQPCDRWPWDPPCPPLYPASRCWELRDNFNGPPGGDCNSHSGTFEGCEFWAFCAACKGSSGGTGFGPHLKTEWERRTRLIPRRFIRRSARDVYRALCGGVHAWSVHEKFPDMFPDPSNPGGWTVPDLSDVLWPFNSGNGERGRGRL